MMDWTHAVLLITTATVTSADQPDQVRRAQLGQFPYIALLNRMELSCTASILTRSWVLTAGHCTDKSEPELYRVTAGIIDIHEPNDITQSRVASEVVKHPRYKHSCARDDSTVNIEYDVAVIKVKEPFVFNEYINSVGLSVIRPPYDFEHCYSVGFGDSTSVQKANNEEYHIGPGTLVIDYKPYLVNPMMCNELHKSQWHHKFQMCTVGHRLSSDRPFQGETGRAMVCGSVQTGVFSMVGNMEYNGENRVAHVHTTTSFFRKWLTNTVPGVQFLRPCQGGGWMYEDVVSCDA